jgi:hypothetical protein
MMHAEVTEMVYTERKKKRMLTLTLGISTIINKMNIVYFLDIQAISIVRRNGWQPLQGKSIATMFVNPSIRAFLWLSINHKHL